MDDRWFRGFGVKTAPGAPRLICFPHAGGAASAYIAFAQRLAPDVEALVVQYPGRQDRRTEPPIDGITRLAEAIAERIVPEADRPYALFGHSMGALVAYETARVLERRNVPAPSRLFLSGRGAPGPTPQPGDRLPDDVAIINEIRRLGGTAGRVLDDPELLELALPALRVDYRALGSYRWTPGPALDVPFTVLVGESDPLVSADAAGGWLDHSTAPTDFHVFPGGHFYLETALDDVLAILRAALRDVPHPSRR